MSTRETLEQDIVAVLTAVVRLLHGATARAAQLAEAEGPRSHLHSLTLDVHLAWADAVHLLPAGVQVQLWPLGQADPVELLRAAEDLTRTLPIGSAPDGTSALVTTLCDLIRAATR